MRHSGKIRLRTLLILLSAGGVMLISVLLLVAILFYQKSRLEERLLENNIAYARKLADTTDIYLRSATTELAWSAQKIDGNKNFQLMRDEADRLRLHTGFFNSVVVVDKDARVLATSPESLNLVGVTLRSLGGQEALGLRRTYISPPFMSDAGNYLIFITHPLISKDGTYKGYIGGTIYLRKQSMLSEILSKHYYINHVSVSILSQEGLIIYSEDPAKVGTFMDIGDGFRQQLVNSAYGKGIFRSGQHKYLAGYARTDNARWDILVTGAASSVRSILISTALNACWFILLIIVLTVALVVFMAGQIARPLESLTAIFMLKSDDITAADLKVIPA